ncbi:hypothetical protein BKA82DRAFT_4020173 [Pisolithus tinctorius]|nr:hypothetical protein BKA82DRAFT_4020173 [Pisolithus tinctorius]
MEHLPVPHFARVHHRECHKDTPTPKSWPECKMQQLSRGGPGHALFPDHDSTTPKPSIPINDTILHLGKEMKQVSTSGMQQDESPLKDLIAKVGALGPAIKEGVDVSASLHQVLTEVWMTKWPKTTGNAMPCPTEQMLALYTLEGDGKHKEPAAVTYYLTRLTYCIHLTVPPPFSASGRTKSFDRSNACFDNCDALSNKFLSDPSLAGQFGAQRDGRMIWDKGALQQWLDDCRIPRTTPTMLQNPQWGTKTCFSKQVQTHTFLWTPATCGDSVICPWWHPDFVGFPHFVGKLHALHIIQRVSQLGNMSL